MRTKVVEIHHLGLIARDGIGVGWQQLSELIALDGEVNVE